MNKKICLNFLKASTFLILTFCMLAGILKIFNYKEMGGGGGWQRLYAEEKEHVDVIFFGSSHAHCTIDHGVLWKQYGIAGYTLSAGGQQIDSTRYLVEEAVKTQKPKVIVVEMLGMLGDEFSDTIGDVYKNSLGMKWSPEYKEFIDYLSERLEMTRKEKQEIFFKIPVIHSRYTELSESDFVDQMPYMRGYRGSYDIIPFEKPEVEDLGEEMAINPQKMKMLQEIISVAEDYEIPIVLFASPFVLTDEYQMQFNTVEAFAQEQGIPFLNYNKMYNELLIDFENDFRDESHVNNYGAFKVTNHMARYLKDNYNLPDHRESAGYELWEENALYLSNKELRNRLEQCADINDYLQCISEIDEEQIIIIALTGNYNALGDVYLNQLMRLGISRQEYMEGGVFLFKGKTRELYFPGKEYNQCIYTDVGELHIESTVQEIDGEEREKVKLLINGENYAMIENGVNIVVYDARINQMVDAAGDDIYLGLEMIHTDQIDD